VKQVTSFRRTTVILDGIDDLMVEMNTSDVSMSEVKARAMDAWFYKKTYCVTLVNHIWFVQKPSREEDSVLRS